MENLFSYGTLQLESVQLSTFGRLLEGRKDSIIGYSLSYIEIVDKDVITKSGKTHHPIITYSGKADDEVEGMVFNVSMEELNRADEYEVSDYKRISVELKSGGETWVYVAV